ncbi:hypothetical protein [Phormidesmis priestleyi]|uniref:hypothetical protein n=1 Tax=Phormidesmis priestleyi TaxID=268141 RepID=UPI0012E95893|nr:hypothetical protein [Phormidesmis priestleyi]
MNNFLTLLLVLSLIAISPAQPNASFITTALSWINSSDSFCGQTWTEKLSIS